MPKHKTAHLQKMLNLKGTSGATPSPALPPGQEQGSSENELENVEPEPGPCDGAQQESLLMQEPHLKTCNLSDHSSSRHGENQQNPNDILSGVDDQQRPLHIVWPHRW